MGDDETRLARGRCRNQLIWCWRGLGRNDRCTPASFLLQRERSLECRQRSDGATIGRPYEWLRRLCRVSQWDSHCHRCTRPAPRPSQVRRDKALNLSFVFCPGRPRDHLPGRPSDDRPEAQVPPDCTGAPGSRAVRRNADSLSWWVGCRADRVCGYLFSRDLRLAFRPKRLHDQ